MKMLTLANVRGHRAIRYNFWNWILCIITYHISSFYHIFFLFVSLKCFRRCNERISSFGGKCKVSLKVSGECSLIILSENTGKTASFKHLVDHSWDYMFGEVREIFFSDKKQRFIRSQTCLTLFIPQVFPLLRVRQLP